MVLTGVGALIEASHEGPTGQLHGHTWEVTAWHECQHHNDAVILRHHLEKLCGQFDHTVLPAKLARAEDMCEAILRLSPPSCVQVDIARANRLYARAMRD